MLFHRISARRLFKITAERRGHYWKKGALQRGYLQSFPFNGEYVFLAYLKMKREVDFNVFGLLKQQLVIKRTIVALNTWHTDVLVSIISSSSRSFSPTIRRSSHYFCIPTI